MAAAKDSVNNISGGSQNPAYDKVDSAEKPINVKASVAENPVNDKEDVVENPVKNDLDSVENFVDKKVDCLPIEAEEGLKSLAGKWENVVDVNALQIIPLKGAMTNEVFQIKWQTIAGESSRKVLARIYGDGTDIFFDRNVEFRTFECMSKNGQGPRLLGRFANGRIEEFINARTLAASDLRDPSISALIAAKMKEFHDLDMPGPKSVCLWDRLRNWLSEAKRLSSPEEVETFHLDTMDKEISVLEKELSGTHLKIDLEERRRFIRTYLSSSGQQPSESEVEQLLNDVEKYTLATHLLWGVWGIISEHVNKIDFDYKEYSKQRFQEYWSRKPNLLKSDDVSSQHNLTHGEKALTYPTKGKREKKPVIFRKLKKLFGTR
ncbi:unnamed protein product [Lupinus luteus]|uniref:Choline kinase 2 n=1 Tax=Lupinus luteus TaxID=3873 RepID=A0AAV1W3A2_LUPLU